MKCTECQKDVEKVRRGLCSICYRKDLENRPKAKCGGCGQIKVIKNKSKGLCGACDMRLRRYGSTAYRERPKKGDYLCIKCERDPVHAKGLCKTCYSKEHWRSLREGECSNCGETGKLISRGLCIKCYKEDIEKQNSAICIGCEEFKPIKAKGMCHKCYQRYLRHDDPTHGRIKKGDEPCSHCGARPIHAKSLCGKCYQRYLKRGDPKRIRAANITECKECGEKKHIRAKGLCTQCYAELIKLGRLGLPKDAYETMYKAQKGLCAICGKPEQYKNGAKKGQPKTMAIDHDHKTGKVRRLLCQLCNQGLGCFHDSPVLLQKAINYLNSPSGD